MNPVMNFCGGIFSFDKEMVELTWRVGVKITRDNVFNKQPVHRVRGVGSCNLIQIL